MSSASLFTPLNMSCRGGHHPHHHCITGCASTYSTRMQENRMRKTNTALILKSSDSTDKQSPEGENVDEFEKKEKVSETKTIKAPIRKFSLEDMRRWETIQGTFRLVSSENYENFLRSVGCGPLSLCMVMRSASMLSIHRTPDEHWRISWETAIKARSVSGYNTSNRKMILNKFFEGQEKMELLDDWDQRVVSSRLSWDRANIALHVVQLADKDQKFCHDGFVEYKLVQDNPEDIVVTNVLPEIGVTAVRRFRRVSSRHPDSLRRHSVL